MPGAHEALGDPGRDRGAGDRDVERGAEERQVGPAALAGWVQRTVTRVPIGVIGQTTAAFAGGISTQPSDWG